MKSLTWRVLTCRVENGVVGSQSRRGGLEISLRNVRRLPQSAVSWWETLDSKIRIPQ